MICPRELRVAWHHAESAVRRVVTSSGVRAGLARQNVRRLPSRSRRAASTRCAPFPPVGLFTVLACVGQGVRGLEPLPAGRPTELPRLGGGTLVPVDEIVELELVDVACVEFGEAVAYSLKQRSEPLLVVGGDELTGGAAACLVAYAPMRIGLGHRPNVQPRGRRPSCGSAASGTVAGCSCPTFATSWTCPKTRPRLHGGWPST